MFVAYGAALVADESICTIEELIECVIKYDKVDRRNQKKTLKPLFKDEADFVEFTKRHNLHRVEEVDIAFSKAISEEDYKHATAK